MKALRRRYGHARAPIYPAYQVRGVLGGAYKGKDLSERALLTHAVGVSADGRDTLAAKSLCNRILEERLVDSHGGEPAGSIPTCPVCRERLAKLGVVTLGTGVE